MSVPDAEGWSEPLASLSEAVVKAERSEMDDDASANPAKLVELQQHTVDVVQKVHAGGQTCTFCMAPPGMHTCVHCDTLHEDACTAPAAACFNTSLQKSKCARACPRAANIRVFSGAVRGLCWGRAHGRLPSRPCSACARTCASAAGACLVFFMQYGSSVSSRMVQW